MRWSDDAQAHVGPVRTEYHDRMQSLNLMFYKHMHTPTPHALRMCPTHAHAHAHSHERGQEHVQERTHVHAALYITTQGRMHVAWPCACTPAPDPRAGACNPMPAACALRMQTPTPPPETCTLHASRMRCAQAERPHPSPCAWPPSCAPPFGRPGPPAASHFGAGCGARRCEAETARTACGASRCGRAVRSHVQTKHVLSAVRITDGVLQTDAAVTSTNGRAEEAEKAAERVHDGGGGTDRAERGQGAKGSPLAPKKGGKRCKRWGEGHRTFQAAKPVPGTAATARSSPCPGPPLAAQTRRASTPRRRAQSAWEPVSRGWGCACFWFGPMQAAAGTRRAATGRGH